MISLYGITFYPVDLAHSSQQSGYSFPFDLIFKIFSFLTSKEIGRCRQVSQGLKKLIDADVHFSIYFVDQFAFHLQKERVLVEKGTDDLAKGNLDHTTYFLVTEYASLDFDKAFELTKQINSYQLSNAFEKLIECAKTKEKMDVLTAEISSRKEHLSERDMIKMLFQLAQNILPKLSFEESLKYLEKTKSQVRVHIFVGLYVADRFPEAMALKERVALASNVSVDNLRDYETWALLEKFSIKTVLNFFSFCQFPAENYYKVKSIFERISSREEAFLLLEAVKSSERVLLAFMREDKIYNLLGIKRILDYVKKMASGVERYQFIYQEIFKKRVSSQEDFTLCVETLVQEMPSAASTATLGCLFDDAKEEYLTEELYQLIKSSIPLDEMLSGYLKFAKRCKSLRASLLEQIKKSEKLDDALLQEIIQLELKTGEIKEAEKSIDSFKSNAEKLKGLNALIMAYIQQENWEKVETLLIQLNSLVFVEPSENAKHVDYTGMFTLIAQKDMDRALHLMRAHFKGLSLCGLLLHFAEIQKKEKKSCAALVNECRTLAFTLFSKKEITRLDYLDCLQFCLKLQTA